MDQLSVVIIARNESHTIRAAVTSALALTNEVIVADSGSTDNTAEQALDAGARVVHINWQGFGQARNEGAAAASHPYILNIDADEVITAELVTAIKQLDPVAGLVYGFRRRNFVATTEVKHGEWGHDTVYRLYNRTDTSWNLDKVHETIIAPRSNRKRIEGSLLHYTTNSLTDYAVKLNRYAELSALKFFETGKPVTLPKLLLSPLFSFIKNYLFRLGFLDGKTGLSLALLHSGYTRKKYKNLRQLYSRARNKK